MRNRQRALSALLSLLLVPALLVGQTQQLSKAARKLQTSHRLGRVRLTLVEGKVDIGRVVKVTNQAVTFKTASKSPSVDQDIELYKIARVEWLPETGQPDGPLTSVKETAGIVLFVTLAAPFYAGHEVSNLARRVAPPLRPLKGDWVAKSKYPSGEEIRLSFADSVVQYSGAAVNPAGTLDQRQRELRKGTVISTPTGLKIQWTSVPGSSVEDWIVQIERHHLVVHAGGVTTKYKYVPPDFITDL